MPISALGKDLTVTKIAKALNLSKTTVSRAITGNGRVGAATRKRVLDFIEQSKNSSAPNGLSFRDKKSGVIGIVLPSDPTVIDTPFFFGCQLGICETATLCGYSVLLLTDTGSSFDYFRALIIGGKLDGLIFTRSITDQRLLDFMKERRFPFVITGSSPDSDIVQVDSDVTSSCEELTKIILNSCPRIAFISGNQNNRVQRLRYEGFLQAFINFDRFADKSIVFLNADEGDRLDDSMELIMQRGADCVIASDDVICLKILYWLNSRSLRIPEDIRVASFYSSSYLAKHTPPITAINIDPKAIGIKAARLLMDIIDGSSVPRKNSVSYEILIRKSTI